MKHITMQHVAKTFAGPVDPKRAPMPFPGRNTPTRIAYVIETGYERVVKTTSNPNYTPDGVHGAPLAKAVGWARHEVHKYIGKPNRLRAIEALKIASLPNVTRMWQVEYDRGGPLAWVRFDGGKRLTHAGNAYVAYHPHSSGIDILQSFAKFVHIKRIAKMSVYSHARRLTQEQLDAYYTWYEATFAKKLKRPRQKPLQVSSSRTVPVPELEDIDF